MRVPHLVTGMKKTIKTDFKDKRIKEIKEALGADMDDFKIDYVVEEGVNDNQTQE